MKVQVDRELCEANAICMRHCEEIFRVEEDDTLTLLMEHVPARLEPAVKEAADRCPRQALTLTN